MVASVDPPGGQGTMRVTGLEGNSAAIASAADKNKTTPIPALKKILDILGFMEIFLLSGIYLSRIGCFSLPKVASKQ
jgi:hypothetical protein